MSIRAASVNAAELKVPTSSARPRVAHLALAFLAIACVALALRLPLVATSTHGWDHWVMREWTRALVTHPLSSFYALDLGDVPQDHLPGDLALFAAYGRLMAALGQPVENGVLPTTGHIKAFAIALDIITIALVWQIVRSLSPSRGRPAALAHALTPGVALVSAQWGQLDALSLALGLAATLPDQRSTRSSALAWALLAWACLIKPQMILLAPIVLARLLGPGEGNLPRRLGVGIASGIATAQLICLPFAVGLPGVRLRFDLLDIVRQSTDQYRSTTLGAPNLWMIPIGRGAPANDSVPLLGPLTAHAIGIALFATIMLPIAVRLWRHPNRMFAAVACSTIAFHAMFVAMTRMHERYLFPVMALSIILAVTWRPARGYAIAINGLYAVEILAARSEGHLPLLHTDLAYRALAIGVCLTLVWLIVIVWKCPLQCLPISFRRRHPDVTQISPRRQRYRSARRHSQIALGSCPHHR